MLEIEVPSAFQGVISLQRALECVGLTKLMLVCMLPFGILEKKSPIWMVRLEKDIPLGAPNLTSRKETVF